MELADQQNSENSGVVADAEIPVSPAAHPADSASPDSPSEPEKRLSLRDQINKSVEAVRKEEATRARDVSTGKFAKVEKPEASAAEKPAAAEIPKTEQNVSAAPTADSPPSAWKNIWDKLPEEARALAVKREAEVTKGFDEYRSKTAQLTEISQALEPLRPVLQQNGIQSDAQAVKTLLNWEAGFRNPETRMQSFVNLAKQYQVDLSTLVQNSSQAPSSVQDSIPEPLRPVLDQFNGIAQKVTNLETQLQRSQEEKVSQELSAFASKPEHAHFEKVRTIMGQLMMAGLVPPGDLEGAYQKATMLHPEVSAQIKLETETKAKLEQDRTQAEKAARARQAAVSPTGRSPTGVQVNGATQPKQGVKGHILQAIKTLEEEQRA